MECHHQTSWGFGCSPHGVQSQLGISVLTNACSLSYGEVRSVVEEADGIHQSGYPMIYGKPSTAFRDSRDTLDHLVVAAGAVACFTQTPMHH